MAVFALPDSFHRDRCVEVQSEVEEALGAHFGRLIGLRLVVEPGDRGPAPGAGPAAPMPPEPPPAYEEAIEWSDLTDAPPGAVASPLDHVMQAFQGAEVVEE